MKTAMQEMIEYLENTWYVKEIRDWEDIKINILEKEKEQIIDFHVMLMKHGLEQEGNEIEWDYDELKKEAEQYYNQTYNQKQITYVSNKFYPTRMGVS